MLKLSVSSIGTYEKCPKNYHYRYIEKPDVKRVKHPATEFGSCAHLALELFHKVIMKKDIPEDKYASLMKWSMKKAILEFDIDILKQDMWSPDGDVPGLELLKVVLQSYLHKIGQEGLPNVVGVEVPYTFEIDGSIMRGYMDRVDIISPGVYHVVDYKTSKNKKYLTDFQLVVYAEAIRRLYPDCKEVHGSFVLLKHNCESMSWRFSDIDYKRALKKISKNNNLIKTDDRWVKKPSILCAWCDYESICQNSWAE
jgi:ATP-dependent helicase/DNAse subunit B